MLTLCNISCCRPNMTSWLHFDMERPCLINRYFYTFGTKFYPQHNMNCYFHNRLRDHNLYSHNFCTDLRSWSNDSEQRRQHFLDVVSGRVKLCNTDIGRNFGLNEDNEEKQKDILFPACSKEGSEKVGPFTVLVENAANDKEEFKETLTILSDKPIDSNLQENYSLNKEDEDLYSVTVNIIDKLYTILGNAEEMFHKFTNKTQEYITNLLKLLDFEKEKSKLIEKKYHYLKKENQILQEHDEQLVEEQIKQLENLNIRFQNVMNENKAAYTKKLCQLEKEKIDLEKYYKTKNLKQCLEINRLKDQLNELKTKQFKILKNHVYLLNCMEYFHIKLSSNSVNKGLGTIILD